MELPPISTKQIEAAITKALHSKNYGAARDMLIPFYRRFRIEDGCFLYFRYPSYEKDDAFSFLVGFLPALIDPEFDSKVDKSIMKGQKIVRFLYTIAITSPIWKRLPKEQAIRHILEGYISNQDTIMELPRTFDLMGFAASLPLMQIYYLQRKRALLSHGTGFRSLWIRNGEDGDISYFKEERSDTIEKQVFRWLQRYTRKEISILLFDALDSQYK